MSLTELLRDTPAYIPTLFVPTNNGVSLVAYSVGISCHDHADGASVSALITANAGVNNDGGEILECLAVVVSQIEEAMRRISQEMEEFNAPPT